MKSCMVTALSIYPVKGCQAVSVDSIDVRCGGIVGDRELMMVKDGENYAQRDHPGIAAISVTVLDDGSIKLSHPEGGEFVHSIQDAGGDVPVKFFYNKITTLDQGDEIAGWCCDVLKDDGIRMVSLPKPWNRKLGLPEFERIEEKTQAQLYDVAPILLNNQASLDDFNGRTEQTVPMNRFRGNVVVSGDLNPYEENEIDRLSSDTAELLYVTVCERCVLTTTDQTTGERPTKEPIKTLSTYQRRTDKYASGIIFGAYMAVGREGLINVGDRFEIGARDGVPV